MRLAGLLIALTLLSSTSAPSRAAGALQVSDPWIREAPPAASVLAGYLELANSGDAPVVIEAVSSPDFGAAEIHRSWIEDGMARMQPVPELSVPPGGSVRLMPGGYHLMLFRPVRPLAAGDTATVLLHRADGACVTVTATVRRATEAATHGH